MVGLLGRVFDGADVLAFFQGVLRENGVLVAGLLATALAALLCYALIAASCEHLLD